MWGRQPWAPGRPLMGSRCFPLQVVLLGMDILSALVTRLQDRFKAQIGTGELWVRGDRAPDSPPSRPHPSLSLPISSSQLYPILPAIPWSFPATAPPAPQSSPLVLSASLPAPQPLPSVSPCWSCTTAFLPLRGSPQIPRPHCVSRQPAPPLHTFLLASSYLHVPVGSIAASSFIIQISYHTLVPTLAFWEALFPSLTSPANPVQLYFSRRLLLAGLFSVSAVISVLL